MSEKLIAKGIFKRKSEEPSDLELQQNFVLDELTEDFKKKLNEFIYQEAEISKGYEFEVVLRTKKLSKQVYQEEFDEDDKWLDVIKNPDPRKIGFLCVDAREDEPEFLGDLPFDFKDEELEQLIQISKENQMILKLNVFHDFQIMDTEEFEALKHMHEHNKFNRSLEDHERAEFMHQSMGNQSEDDWICGLCESEQTTEDPYFITQYGLACTSCFDNMMGFSDDSYDEEEDDEQEEEAILEVKKQTLS